MPWSIHRLVQEGDLAAVQRYVDDGGDIQKKGGQYRCSLLHEACRFHKASVVELLLEAGAKVDARGGGMWRPIHYACDGKEEPELVALLMEHKANTNSEDYIGKRPLHVAAKNGFFDVAMVLVHGGADPNAADSDGRTALHYAAMSGSVQMVKFLVGLGVDLHARDRIGDTPLHMAVRAHNTVIANLLERAGADPDHENNWGALAFCLAPGYKMNPGRRYRAPEKCEPCGAKGGKHYYFCKKEILDETHPAKIIKYK